jgi:flagellar hook assembly protein FlgD
MFSIPAGTEGVETRVTIYDLRGRLVKTVVDDVKDPGYYQVHWDGRDDRGAHVASGVYIYKITAGDFSSSRKMVVVR